MFYEMRDKQRYDSGSSCLGRCWVLVAMCGLLITVSFIGMTLWLGMNSRPDAPAVTAYQPPAHVVPNVHRQHHYEMTTAKSTFPTADYDAMPTTSIKNKKGRIEIVEHEKMAKIEPTTPITRTLQHETTNGPQQLGDGVNPMEEALQEQDEQETAVESSRVNGVRKKSEVVYPNWSQGLEGEPEDRDEGAADERPQAFQPYYVSEQPDAQKFNPIPAFSYLKEHPVRLSEKDIRPPGTGESEEYPYFYPQFEDVTPDEKTAGANNPVFTFLRKRLQDVRDWLAQSGVRKNQSQWIQVVDAVNQSLYTRNSTIVLSKLREMYANTSDVAADTPVASLIYPAAANDSAASLVSFGLLAIDLFLLHNVQQIALNEDAEAGQQMLNDPDVVALNALFLPPDRVKQLRSANSRVLSDDHRRDRNPKGFITELMEFVNGGLRAVLNLSRAYRSSSRAAKAEGKSVGDNPTTSGSSLDCIWTLYCRNLDKTAKLDGPYGFLAKMNR